MRWPALASLELSQNDFSGAGVAVLARSNRLPQLGSVEVAGFGAREVDSMGRPDGYLIRRAAVDNGVPLITDLKLATAVVEALRAKRDTRLDVRSWNEFLEPVAGGADARADTDSGVVPDPCDGATAVRDDSLAVVRLDVDVSSARDLLRPAGPESGR